MFGVSRTDSQTISSRATVHVLSYIYKDELPRTLRNPNKFEANFVYLKITS